jgi:hypothetical protein
VFILLFILTYDFKTSHTLAILLFKQVTKMEEENTEQDVELEEGVDNGPDIQFDEINQALLSDPLPEHNAEPEVEENEENVDGNDEFKLLDVGLAAIRDGVVSERTRTCYTSEIFTFLQWLRFNEPNVLTQCARDLFLYYEAKNPNTNAQRILFVHRQHFETALRNADTIALIKEDQITPHMYMNYCRTLRHRRNRTYLSKSAYGVKRSALFHLYRLHNGDGYSESFKLRLSNLFRGFFRVLVQRRRTVAATVVVPNNKNSAAQLALTGEYLKVIFF